MSDGDSAATGPLRFAFEADLRPNGFTWRFVGWRLGPVPLPKTLAPRMHARAVDDAGRSADVLPSDPCDGRGGDGRSQMPRR